MLSFNSVSFKDTEESFEIVIPMFFGHQLYDNII